MISDADLKAKLLQPIKDPGEYVRQNSQPIINTPSNTMKISLRQYVDNPTGKGSAYVAARSAIKTGLNALFVKLLKDYRKAFYAIPYVYANGNILFYVKVPSEDYSNNKISYDVLFLIEKDDSRRLALRNIQIFSNCPSFVYTYCYVYNKNGLLIDSLKSKFPNEALTKPPVVRNPIESLGFERSTYLAARYLIDGNCLSDAYIRKYGKDMTLVIERDLMNRIASSERIEAVYSFAKYNERKKHKTQLSSEERVKRQKITSEYRKDERKNKPKGNFIVQRTPRSKITAKKARRNLLNN